MAHTRGCASVQRQIRLGPRMAQCILLRLRFGAIAWLTLDQLVAGHARLLDNVLQREYLTRHGIRRGGTVLLSAANYGGRRVIIMGETEATRNYFLGTISLSIN